MHAMQKAADYFHGNCGAPAPKIKKERQRWTRKGELNLRTSSNRKKDTTFVRCFAHSNRQQTLCYRFTSSVLFIYSITNQSFTEIISCCFVTFSIKEPSVAFSDSAVKQVMQDLMKLKTVLETPLRRQSIFFKQVTGRKPETRSPYCFFRRQ